MRKLVLLLMAIILSVSHLWAQQRTITGKVTDDKGAPIPGASIVIKGTNLGTSTGSDGSFSISVPSNSKALIISSIGLGEKEITLNSNLNYPVTLSTKAGDMTEIVVVAYGTRKKSDITGSVATVKAADIENKPFTSVDKALQGQVAGLQSVASSGQPGANQAIIIRGISSITASTSPLWVVDGVPINTGDVSRLQTTANVLSTLNPNDIESIAVLKDAASQSIYGSRAANGVIIVTTKKGRSGRTLFRFDTEIGSSDIAYENERYKPLNAEKYFTIAKEGMVNNGRSQTYIDNTLNGLGYNNGIDYNWYDNVVQSGTHQQYNLSAQGGSDRTTFYLSGGHLVQEGTTINSKLKRYNGNIRLTHRPNEKITLNFNLNGGAIDQKAPLAGGAFGNPVLSSYFLLPSYSAYNPDGSYNFTSLGGLHNTIALSEIDKRFLREMSMRGSISGDYRILDNLTFRTSYGIDYNTLEEDQYNNPRHGDGAASNGRAFAYYTRYFNWVWTNTLNLTQNLTKNGDMGLNAQIGYESQKSSAYFSSVQSQDFPPTLLLTYPSAGARPTTAQATISEYSFLSYFGSANVSYKNRYVASGSIRRDGSSRFGANNRYGLFWSAGVSWNVDKEDFMQNITFISQLKLRGSYGVNGNAGIGNYDWLPLYGFGNNYNQLPGSAPSNVGDSNLTWELNKPLNIGIDVGFLKNRINITADWYQRQSEDLLLDVPLSRTTGFSSARRNIGAMQNEGIELTINATPIRGKDFSWIVDFNFAHNKNTITSLPGGNDIADGNFIIRQGEAYRTFFLRAWAGVNSQNGDPIWYTDASHTNSTSTYPSASARELSGNALPKYFGSLTNTVNFKNFTLDAQLYYNYGNYVYDTWGGYYLGAGFGATFNKVERVLDRWQKPGDVSDIPKYVEGGNKSFQSASTFWVNKGDYVRLRNIQLGYKLPKELLDKIKLSSAFFYVRGTNLWTWVRDEGLPFDPEQGTTSASNLNVFIPKTVSVGLTLAF